MIPIMSMSCVAKSLCRSGDHHTILNAQCVYFERTYLGSQVAKQSFRQTSLSEEHLCQNQKLSS